MSLNIPPRSSSAVGGMVFLTANERVQPNSKREELFMAEILGGNVPEFLRSFVEVISKIGNETLVYYVLPDFLCIGSDDDFAHVPLEPGTARKIADSLGCMLPTPKMAYQIWQSSYAKLTPSPNGPPYTGVQQLTSKLIENELRIKKQMEGAALGNLVAGHKKDVVICKKLTTDPSRVAIYGWWYPDGRKIQPLNAFSHDKSYKDYSHGIRLVSRSAKLNGQKCDLFDILNSVYSELISDEGMYDASNIYI